MQTGRASHARVTASARQEGAEGCEGGFEPAARARHRKGKHRKAQQCTPVGRHRERERERQGGRTRSRVGIS